MDSDASFLLFVHFFRIFFKLSIQNLSEKNSQKSTCLEPRISAFQASAVVILNPNRSEVFLLKLPVQQELPLRAVQRHGVSGLGWKSAVHFHQTKHLSELHTPEKKLSKIRVGKRVSCEYGICFRCYIKFAGLENEPFWGREVLRGIWRSQNGIMVQFLYFCPEKEGSLHSNKKLNISPMVCLVRLSPIFPTKKNAFRRMMISMTTSMISPMPGGMYQMPDKYLRTMECSRTVAYLIGGDGSESGGIAFGGVNHSCPMK